MIKISTRSKGNENENLAEEFLKKKGFIAVERNYTMRGGELDLIMQDNEFLVFVEVKSLTKSDSFSIYETMTRKKKQLISRSIKNYLYKKKLVDTVWRVDFVGIVTDYKGNVEVEHFEFVDLN